MKLATWNVNSLKVRLPQVLDFLTAQTPDVLCLQETKIKDDKFPLMEIVAAGYQAICCGQKTYNGVAILSRNQAADVVMGIDGYVDPHKRFIAATVDGVPATLDATPHHGRMLVPVQLALDGERVVTFDTAT